MKSILSLKPIAQSRRGVEYGSGPIMLYEVQGLPEGRAISIRNVRAQSQEPVWQFGAHFKGYPYHIRFALNVESRCDTKSGSKMKSGLFGTR
jgi:hypothetical protein